MRRNRRAGRRAAEKGFVNDEGNEGLQADLTADERKLDAVWSEHLRAEFSSHSPDETIVTMSANPLSNQVPVMIGGDGREEVYQFYTKYFLNQIPPDAEMVPVSRTIGQAGWLMR